MGRTLTASPSGISLVFIPVSIRALRKRPLAAQLGCDRLI